MCPMGIGGYSGAKSIWMKLFVLRLEGEDVSGDIWGPKMAGGRTKLVKGNQH